VTDAVELYYEQLPSPPSAASLAGDTAADGGQGAAAAEATEAVTVAGLVERQGGYLRESLGLLPLPLTEKPPGSHVLAREETNIGGNGGAAFAAVLAAPKGSATAVAAAAGRVGLLSVS
jgi:hypothetical protein